MPSNVVALSSPALVPITLPETAPAAAGLPRHLDLLTVFRFFAAAWVLVFHFQFSLGKIFPAPLHHLFANGAYAMSFFFVLSGTVLAYGGFELAATPQAAWGFYRARLARIYPTYALVHLIGLFFLEVPTSDWPRWMFVNLLSVIGAQAWFSQANVGMNGATWSLSCEFFFYLLFPALLPLLRALALRHLLRGVVYLSLFAGFLGLADFAFAREGTFPHAYISPLIRLPEFVIGMLVGIALRRRRPEIAASAWPVVIAAVGVVLASFNTVYQFGMWTRMNVIIVPLFAALIFAAGCFEIANPHRLKNKLWRALKYLGQASFALFLVQLPILILFRLLLSRNDATAALLRSAPVVTVLVFGAGVVAVSVVCYEIFEKPMRRLLLRRPAVL